jgi:predicted nucleic acid-binding protein
VASRRARVRRRAARPPAPQPLRYIESSALVAAFLEADVPAHQAIRAPGRKITSALTLTEAHRAVLRGRVTGRLTAENERDAIRGLQTFARRCQLVALSEDVLVRAGRPFPVEPIRTLDAIHLATIEVLGEPPQLVTVVTRDSRVQQNARALGYVLA